MVRYLTAARRTSIYATLHTLTISNNEIAEAEVLPSDMCSYYGKRWSCKDTHGRRVERLRFQQRWFRAADKELLGLLFYKQDRFLDKQHYLFQREFPSPTSSLQRTYRKVAYHRVIHPENGRRSFAAFAQAGNPYNRKTGTPFETKPRTYIKRSGVGQSVLLVQIHKTSVWSDVKTVLFTDVMASQERLYTFTDSAEEENQLVNLSQPLLAGYALIKWNSELTAQKRQQLRDGGGLPVGLEALR
ncbi:hypothetical protein CONLIGDRAFT_685923 [Coniochaeta ligniaria NRRL 30616]|uniref:Uncharacterized protein n=1 Tax=Coniochaeta ligniaria NRRL 30616 TaxID=1408157 RepID=A0A1J7J9T8_9PEZI|nr:hypothetical protein CONLIGDRAFT_685923 [Coniochaeta ligniaria NRRL 30616]